MTASSTRLPVFASLALYGLSLALPVGMFSDDRHGAPGYAVLLLGWLRILGGGFDWSCWYANVAYATALVGLFARNLRVSSIAGLVATALSLTMLLPFGRYDSYNNFSDYVLFGYWIWIAAIALIPVTSIALMRASTESQRDRDREAQLDERGERDARL